MSFLYLTSDIKLIRDLSATLINILKQIVIIKKYMYVFSSNRSISKSSNNKNNDNKSAAIYLRPLKPVDTDNYENVNQRAVVHISPLMCVEGEGLLCGMEI